jgi:hypothetical protein
VPEIDAGTVDGRGQRLSEAWVTLTEAEAREILEALTHWAEQREGFTSPGWHMHVTDAAGNELTLAIRKESEA